MCKMQLLDKLIEGVSLMISLFCSVKSLWEAVPCMLSEKRQRQILYDMGNLKNTQTSECNKKEADPQITANKLSGYQWGERSGAGEERGWGVGGVNYYI